MTDAVPPTAAPVCYRHPDRETYISCQRCGRPICPDCMSSASVGFQCPDCVKQGVRATRQGRTAYGGRVSGNPALTSQILIAINIAVWLLIAGTGRGTSEWVARLGLIPDIACVRATQNRCVEVASGVAEGSWWQLGTSMFTHIEIWHIGFNMLALFILGPQLEMVLGRARYLALYLLSGLAGSVAVYWLAHPNSLTVGASGAIFGLMGALSVITFKVHGNIAGIGGWIVANFAITFLAGSNISWQGHLGGFIGGVLLGVLMAYSPRDRRTLVQVIGLVTFAVVLLALVAVRTAQLV